MQLVDRGCHEPCTARAERVAEGDCAAVRVDARVVVGKAEVAQHREALRGEGFIQLDDVDLRQRQTGQLQHLAGGRRWAHAHDARRDASGRHADDAGARREPMTGCARFVGEEQRTGAVVDARRIAGRHGAVGLHDAFELGQRVERGLTRMLVLRDDDGLALLLRDGDRRDLGIEEAAPLCGDRLQLRRESHAVLRLALDLEFGGDVFGRLGHRIDAVQFLHQLVDEAPADGRVVDRVVAAECGLGLRHHERRAAHAFDAAGDHQLRLAALDGARCGADRVHPRTAQAVDRRARHADRQPGQQRRHARDVAVVFAGLVGAAEDHVAHGLPIDARVARHQRLQRDRTEVVGTHR